MASILSLSGGLDSTTLLLHLLLKNKPVYAVSFNYGQKHNIEIQFAERNILYLKESGYDINHKIIDISDVVTLLKSSLTDLSIDVPEGHYMNQNMKSTFVPNRNAIFSSIIYGYAISIYKTHKTPIHFSLGVHAGDHLIYPDCRPKFYSQLIKSFKVGNWDSEEIELYLPYIEYEKVDIIQDGIKSCEKLNLNYKEIYKNTLTTYSPDDKGYSNGKTGSDIERILAFKTLGIQDPGLYHNSWDELVMYAVKCEEEKNIN